MKGWTELCCTTINFYPQIYFSSYLESVGDSTYSNLLFLCTNLMEGIQRRMQWLWFIVTVYFCEGARLKLLRILAYPHVSMLLHLMILLLTSLHPLHCSSISKWFSEWLHMRLSHLPEMTSAFVIISDNDPKVIAKQEIQQPDCLALSYVLRWECFTQNSVFRTWAGIVKCKCFALVGHVLSLNFIIMERSQLSCLLFVPCRLFTGQRKDSKGPRPSSVSPVSMVSMRSATPTGKCDHLIKGWNFSTLLINIHSVVV